MTFFEAIISPFIFIIEHLFLLGFELTNNFGAAIILLSFGISLLLLPVFVFIEKAKKKDDAIKHKMQPSVDIIKRVYKGQERYYYLKTLNRQFGYNPLKALIPILSLLLQIPFFIAAYQYLESYEALKGISFWFINDLSQADGLLGTINILPIAMTVINLITAWFYTRGGNTSERKQMLIVAAAFLILLFNLPAGLVLYWTMNNVFSFFRLFVTNPEVFKKKESAKISFEFKSTLNKLFSKNRIVRVYSSLIFFAIYFYIVHLQNIENSADTFLKLSISVVFVIAALVLGQILYVKKIGKSKSNTQTSSIKNYTLAFYMAALFICGFIFLWNPINVYASFPEGFEFSLWQLLKSNIIHFVVASILLVIVFVFSNKTIKQYLTVVIVGLTAIGLYYGIISPLDLGILQDNKFVQEANLNQPLQKIIIEGVLLLTLFLLVSELLKKDKKRITAFLLIVLNVISASEAITNAINIPEPKKEIDDSIPSTISFSKDKQNVIYILPDMFHGWYVDSIKKQNPNIHKTFEGFTWFPNTLSASALTSTSLPAMLGGSQYSVENMNKDERPWDVKITEITENLYNKVKSKGFNFTTSYMIYSLFDNNKFDAYLPAWHDNWNEYNEELGIGFPKEKGFAVLRGNATLQFAPLVLKPLIYNNGDWFYGGVKTNANTSKIKPYNFVRLLPYISNTDSEKSSFIYLHLKASHHTWDTVSNKGVITEDVTPYENNKWVLEKLGDWLQWMKDNDVYNNTRIVIVSDHSVHWWWYEGKMNHAMPLIENKNLNVRKDIENIPSLFPLLMMKDFNQKGDIKTDWRLMGNVDAMPFALGESNPLIDPVDKNRVLESEVVYWYNKMHKDSKLNIIHKFKVRDNVFDLNNWEQIK